MAKFQITATIEDAPADLLAPVTIAKLAPGFKNLARIQEGLSVEGSRLTIRPIDTDRLMRPRIQRAEATHFPPTNRSDAILSMDRRRAQRPVDPDAETARRLFEQTLIEYAQLNADVVLHGRDSCRDRLRHHFRQLEEHRKIFTPIGWKKAIARAFNGVLDTAEWGLAVQISGVWVIGILAVLPGSNPEKGYFQLRHAGGTAGNVFAADLVARQSP